MISHHELGSTYNGLRIYSLINSMMKGCRGASPHRLFIDAKLAWWRTINPLSHPGKFNSKLVQDEIELSNHSMVLYLEIRPKMLWATFKL